VVHVLTRHASTSVPDQQMEPLYFSIFVGGRFKGVLGHHTLVCPHKSASWYTIMMIMKIMTIMPIMMITMMMMMMLMMIMFFLSCCCFVCLLLGLATSTSSVYWEPMFSLSSAFVSPDVWQLLIPAKSAQY
jgi:hypothetical protein